ncbi:hypothetical protein M2459_002933 [Parabacteroides sp. PF5-5]|uniref:FeoB-associated Cys-rich membrane protein n=1 Tax=unclassified Parabacteroides TaxID=2649774 RepID=UPI00247C9E87|nr:hypothetical protein [Parabacteroides sp. PH5-39]MDH6317178.1 hypothetical protein [Parabacteroides sp. PF5-13]MDH6320931.1 hypothetical protein [Parabacteroides sp. PH5-13]MDH6324662.1 hypothetical protein [Parabacteroides sp. PH5-8]MDH6328287.1 hypothetical protein [Parabacteroides sp. PH5-41]MDH6336165.1 hypothetical protein [Parabacteroides sp. PF5-5]MDH6347229.1 hypothetical protein [Parabacteroides sp. PH5-46]MDH6362191.1 hypothetical protein [Parabacteroides sp. PH5-16]MDH6377783.
MWQYIAIAIVGTMAVGYTLYSIYRMVKRIRKNNNPCAGCSGCVLKDQIKSPKDCPETH